jgi:uncharacterized ferredoxin-like protein
MTEYNSDQAEKEAARITAMLMAASARTAPKTRGLDSIKTLVLDGDDVQKLAEGMELALKSSAFNRSHPEGKCQQCQSIHLRGADRSNRRAQKDRFPAGLRGLRV